MVRFIFIYNRFRQYGLWDRYTALYPRNDLVYIVGVSDYKKDWFKGCIYFQGKLLFFSPRHSSREKPLHPVPKADLTF